MQRALYSHFPRWRTEAWALLHTDSVLWSDHLSAMSSFGMCILMGGLLGSLCLYISLSLSAAREDTTGKALASWNRIGFPMLGFLLFVLMAGCMVLLFAQDAYNESQDPYSLRSGRYGSYSKIAMLFVFIPLLVIFATGSVMSLVRSCRLRL